VFHRRRGAQSKWHHLEYDVVRREIPDGSVHLDIGCGPGTFIGTLPVTVQSIGLDLAATQIRYAREHYAAPNRSFEIMSPAQVPLPDGSVSVVTLIEVIEHLTVDEIRALLDAVRRVLSPGGRVVLTTPNYTSLWPVLEWVVNRCAEVSYEEQHITRFNAARLETVLSSSGFQIEKVSSFLFASPFVAPFGWRLADAVARVELPFINVFGRWRGGHLLLGIGRKS
jgi:2-polyprenyl-3-methyl-5-hydroxy-6-metoxy-1,4-benzoquinol methylase